jgi:3-oxo-5-alpha-steroid 4-dehydrogenase 1
VIPLYLWGPHARAPVSLALLGLWLTHYVYRTLVFPFQLKNPERPMPLAIPAMAIGFNCLNALVIGTTLSWVREYPMSWFTDPRFLIGTALFFAGTWINRRSDRILRDLRAPGATTYAIPHGGLYEYVSCPNYFGEVVLWFGFALASWSVGGLAFALYTCANLIPRAVSHHRWYHEKFPDYPAERRAVLPFVL